MAVTKSTKSIIGWREYVSLSDLGLKNIKAKVDTGARSSALHAFDISYYKRGKKTFVKFKVHPEQRNTKKTLNCKAELYEFRKVKSSNGLTEERPVILTTILLMDRIWEVELTLTNRYEMGFRMLLGRRSLRKRFLIDVTKSYLGKKVLEKRNRK